MTRQNPAEFRLDVAFQAAQTDERLADEFVTESRGGNEAEEEEEEEEEEEDEIEWNYW